MKGGIGMTTAVLFDLFETLVTQKDPLYGIVKRIGISDILQTDEEVARREFSDTRKDRHEGKIRTRIEAVEQIAEKRSLRINHELLEEYQHELDARKREAFGKIDPSVLEMLKALNRTGTPTCLVTNCEEFEIEYYRNSELPSLIDCEVFSCREGVAKPDSGIYLKAMSGLGKTPEECVFVGDGGTSELQGAEACGIGAYQACWYLRKYEEEFWTQRIQPFPRLEDPLDVLRLVG
jgi:HAD superfamily hydrolase (TIGR01509 family)